MKLFLENLYEYDCQTMQVKSLKVADKHKNSPYSGVFGYVQIRDNLANSDPNK